MSARIDEAIAIMRANDRGGFTVPTPRLYPYQWNWDSAFAALGFAIFDRDRAWREIETLFDAQWPDGMVPHIVFRRNDPDYFPGPDVWSTGSTPPSSGHSQPAVATCIVEQFVATGDASDLERARKLYPALLRYHRWFHAARDPDGTGLIAIIHPWESGRDNCPDWDSGLDRMEVAPDLGTYQRRDISHVNASERPTQDQYNRFLTIVKFGRDCGWNQQEIYRNGPFLMVDPCVHFVLQRADQDLLALARLLGEPTEEIEGWLALYPAGAARLWNAQVEAFTVRDLRGDLQGDGITNASFLCLYAGAGTDAQRARMVQHLREIQSACKVGVPSWDPRHAAYEPQRYWRGPVWAMMNYMIVDGLERQGETAFAEELRAQTIDMIETGGFFENFNAATGEGCGGGDFTWTAAIYLAWTAGLAAARAA
ncbi:MAG: trehalase family glycosidase [Pseudomonadota bacterium]